MLTPAPPVASAFPQSLAACQQSDLARDLDEVTGATLYFLNPGDRLEIGKYVPDPKGKDIANPRYSAKLRPSTAAAAGVATAEPVADGSGDADGGSDGTVEEEPDGGEGAPRTPCDGPVPASERVVYRLVRGAAGVPAVFFPIHYGVPTAKDRADPKGLPEAINTALHGPDRPAVAGAAVAAAVQGHNLNKLCLYKIGPGAVAFKVVVNALEAGGLKYTPSNRHFNVLWAKRATPEILARLGPYQKVNHFPATWGIGRKDSLHKNVSRMKRQFGHAAFAVVPATFMIPGERDALEEDHAQAMAETQRPPTYIVKPSASSCGKGIKLYRGLPPMPRGGKSLVCQRYIGNPLLIEGRKFDLRMYCVVTSFDPLRIFLFDQGLVRFAAERYPGCDRNLENSYMHLTNYSVNKTAELARASRGESMESDKPIDIKWTISDLKEWLRRERGDADGRAAWDRIYTEAQDVVIKTFLSIENEVVSRLRSDCRDPSGRGCFELYGLDLMVDDALRVVLLEVNIMPSLATGSTLDKAVKSRMLAHMLTLVGVVPFARSQLEVDAANGAYVPRGPEPSGDRYFFTGVRGAARGRDDRTNCPLLTSFGDCDITREERLMLLESDEELYRAGGFERIFPTAATAERYFPFFTGGVTRSNFLLASWEAAKTRSRRQSSPKR